MVATGHVPYRVPVEVIESFIGSAHRVARRLRYRHPYFLMSDVAIGAAVLTAVGASLWWEAASWWKLAAPMVAVHVLGYPLFLRVKGRLLGTSARSAIQDTVLFVIPVVVLVAVLLGQPFRVATDYLGLTLPVMLALYRVGCLAGGCCYGRPSRYGIRYPAELVYPARGRLRAFECGPVPGTPVLPLQLLDGAANIAIWCFLVGVAALGPPGLSLLPLYLALYSASRLVVDRYRGHRHRPVHGPFSEAQWMAMAVIAGSAIWLVSGLSVG